MKSRLLKEPFFDFLLRQKSLNDLVRAFEATPYEEDVNEGILIYSGYRGIEEGLKLNLTRNFNKLLHEVTDEKIKKYIELIVGRWDVHNIKTILRGKHMGVPFKEIRESFIPGGNLSEAALIQLAKKTKIREMIDLLATWGIDYSIPLKRNYYRYTKDRKISDYELSLDKFYYKNALEELTGRFVFSRQKVDKNIKLLRELFRSEIDTINILTLLRLSREMIEADTMLEYYLEGGKYINRELFLKLSKLGSPEEITEALDETPYYSALKKGISEYFISHLVSPVQRRLEELIIKRCTDLFGEYPLSIAPIIAYLWAKYNEVVNLRIVIRCKQLEIPEKKIRETLIFC